MAVIVDTSKGLKPTEILMIEKLDQAEDKVEIRDASRVQKALQAHREQ